MRRLFLLNLAILIIGLPRIVLAMQVDQVLYDPVGTDGGHEWLTIFNDDNEILELTGWRLQIANQSHHKLTAYPDSASRIILNPGQRAIITAKPDVYLQDNPLNDEMLIKAAISLPNSSDTERVALNFYDGDDNLRYEMDYPLIKDLDSGGQLHLINDAWEIVAPSIDASPQTFMSPVNKALSIKATPSVNVSPKTITAQPLKSVAEQRPRSSPEPDSTYGSNGSSGSSQATDVTNISMNSGDRRLLIVSLAVAAGLFVLSLGISYWWWLRTKGLDGK